MAESDLPFSLTIVRQDPKADLAEGRISIAIFPPADQHPRSWRWAISRIAIDGSITYLDTGGGETYKLACAAAGEAFQHRFAL